MPPTHYFSPLPHSQGGQVQDNAPAITKLFADGGPGTTVFLRQSALYVLHSVIDLTHPHTTLATEGYPAFESGRQAIVETRGEKEAGAVAMFNKSGCALKRVHVRGCRGWGRTKPSEEEAERLRREEGALGWIEGGGALIWMGGPEAERQVVEGCRLEDPRGWTAVHVTDWANHCKLINNVVGPCGQQAGGGPWADGLSIAGRNTILSGNTIIDATDGMVVLFCAPGSVVTNNHFIARTRDALGAINLVDDFPFQTDYTGTIVAGNTITTERDAYIRLAIGSGPTCWSPWQPFHTLNHGGQVLDNMIGPGTFGYGVALSGVKDWKALGNVIMPGARFEGNLGNCLYNAPPMPFLAEWDDRHRTLDSELQKEFVRGEAQWLIGSDPGRGERLIYEEGQIEWTPESAGAWVKGGRWHLSRQGELVLLDEATGRVGWRSGPAASAAAEPVLRFGLDGKLAITAKSGELWSPSSYLDSALAAYNSQPPPPPRNQSTDAAPTSANKDAAGHASLTINSQQPFLQLKDKDGNTLYSTSYTFERGFNMKGREWIAVAPVALRGVEGGAGGGGHAGAPPVPSKPVGYSPDPNAPPVPARPAHLGGHSYGHGLSKLGGFRELAHELHQAWNDASRPPPVPPRPGSNPGSPQPTSSWPPAPGSLAPHSPDPTCPAPTRERTAFLLLSTATHQLIFHSSPSPAHPQSEHIHWTSPLPDASLVRSTSVSLQGDGNLVLYCEWNAGGNGVLWASGTNGGEHEAERIVLKGEGEGGARVELVGKGGKVVWTTRG